MLDEEKSAFGRDEQVSPLGEQEEKYEISFLVKEGADPEVVTPFITKRNGTITEKAKHGLRKLAFKIKKVEQADLHTFYFTAPKDQIIKIERDLTMASATLRFLMVKEVQKPAPAPVRDMVRAREQQEEKAGRGSKTRATETKKTEAPEAGVAKPKEKVEKIEAKELDEKLKKLTEE